jgi:hypothetical protein
MAYFEQGSLVIRGDVKRAYNLPAKVEEVYEYLSNMRNLLSQIPNTRKLQIGTRTGRSRILVSVMTMGVSVDGVIDVEPTLDPENRIVRLKTPTEPLGPIPPNHLTGNFQGFIKTVSNENGGSHVSSRIVLAFDASQVELLNLFPRSLIEASGPALLQEYAEALCDEYIRNLMRSFREWLTNRRQQLA